jgi:hypothetical protein
VWGRQSVSGMYDCISERSMGFPQTGIQPRNRRVQGSSGHTCYTYECAYNCPPTLYV